MSSIEYAADVDVPVRTAYNQWTQFESFPRFMPGVLRVDRKQSALTHWVAKCWGMTCEFDAEIVAQRPDERVTWRSLAKPVYTGTVTFHSLSADRCRVTLRIDFEPKGMAERLGDRLGLVHRRVHADMNGFKAFIERQGRETGGWRGEIDGCHVQPNSGQDRPHVPSWPTG